MVGSFIYMLWFRLWPFKALVEHIICYKSHHIWSAESGLRLYEWPVHVDIELGKIHEFDKAYRSEHRVDLQILCSTGTDFFTLRDSPDR